MGLACIVGQGPALAQQSGDAAAEVLLASNPALDALKAGNDRAAKAELAMDAAAAVLNAARGKKPDILDNKSAVLLDDPYWKPHNPGHNFQVSGFLQSRITDISSAGGDRDVTRAEVTRFRPTLSYTPDRFWEFHVQVDLSTRGRPLNSVNGRDTYIEYHSTGNFMRVGQAKIPFGYEEWQEGDERRAAMERARVLTTLFPSERDTGIWYSTEEPQDSNNKKKRVIRPTYTAALLTGDGIDKYYENVGKTLALRARIPYHQNVAFDLSLFTGRSNESSKHGVELVKQAYGPAYQGAWGRVGTQAEFLWGRAYGHDIYGGYEQATYDFKVPGVLFARHDLFNPNTAVGGVMWNRESFGLYKDLGNFRVTGEYDFVNNKAKPADKDTFAFQFQMVY